MFECAMRLHVSSANERISRVFFFRSKTIETKESDGIENEDRATKTPSKLLNNLPLFKHGISILKQPLPFSRFVSVAINFQKILCLTNGFCLKSQLFEIIFETIKNDLLFLEKFHLRMLDLNPHRYPIILLHRIQKQTNSRRLRMRQIP
ncbi:hypothetical protein QR98_0005290 [Sarcoptes scabiei]|uniref:Uncharacterized protein n=1 Tax=Sarcoptes scabiei TaxID=52283 RepID=A0A131ZTL9_SARSC|nr:hypothetical protein QR98_0005290 [Sarcoptes scabiei]